MSIIGTDGAYLTYEDSNVVTDSNIVSEEVITNEIQFTDGTSISSAYNYGRYLQVYCLESGDINTSTYNTFQQINLFDTANNYSTNGGFATTQSEITILNDGVYEIFGTFNMQSTASNRRSYNQFCIGVNGTLIPVISGAYIRAQSGHTESSVNLQLTLQLFNGDTITVHTRRTITNVTAGVFLRDDPLFPCKINILQCR